MFKKLFEDFKNSEAGQAGLVGIAIGITILLIVLAYVFAPVGLVAFQATNLTAAGLTAGTPGLAIWQAIIPISMAVIILALVGMIRQST